MSQPDYNAVLQGFFAWERKSWIYVVVDFNTEEKSAFVPVKAIEKYFQDNRHSRLNEILSLVFQPDEPPVDSEVVLRSYTAVFCILLHIHKARYIGHFVRYEDLSDQRLPLSPASQPTSFPTATDDPNFFQRFCEKQWMYCVPTFHPLMIDKYFESNRLLPITHKEIVASGGSATVYKIELYGPHNRLFSDSFQPEVNSNPSANTFILKTYRTKDAETHYNHEVTGFRKVGPNASIIGFYGSYKHGNSLNIILEYADKGDLEHYFQNESPPTHGEDIVKFWKGLFNITTALHIIHNMETQGSGDRPQFFQGWHQDVKPANILVMSRGAKSAFDWQFKLADLGLSQFTRKASAEEELTAIDAQGTRAYGAPECYRLDDVFAQSKLKVKQSVDIWSLGCIYSEAAIWIAEGYKGLIDYRQQRKAETDLIPDFRDGNCFHNGAEVLKAVREAHKNIEGSLRKSDYITKNVLDIMVEEMLWDSDSRPTARQLLRKYTSVLEKAHEMPSADRTGDVFMGSGGNTRNFVLRQPPVLPPPQFRFPQQPQLAGNEKWSPRPTEPPEQWGSMMSEGQRYSHENESSGLASNCRHFPSPTSQFVHTSGQFDHNRSLSEAQPHPHEGPRLRAQQKSNDGFPSPTHLNPMDFPSGGRGTPRKHGFNSFSMGDNAAWSPTDGSDNSRSSALSQNPHTSSHSSPCAPSRAPAPTSIQTSQAEQLPSSPGPNDPPNPSKSPNQQDISYDSSGQTTRQMQSIYSTAPILVTSPTEQFERPASNQSYLQRPHPAHQNETFRQPETVLVRTVLEWKRESKKMKKEKTIEAQAEPLPGIQLLSELKDRDHVFVIDDASSMKQHWTSVESVFEALSYLVKNYDPDGIELYFTISNLTRRVKNTTDLLKVLYNKKQEGQTDITNRIGLLLDDYRSKIQKNPLKSSARSPASKRIRPVNLYVFTDGLWISKPDFAAPIKQLVDQLIKFKMKHKQVGIQFISFGNDADGLQRMNDLSSKLKLGLDIVDTTPSTGNVWKMLLGAMDKKRFHDPDKRASNASS